jgi:hypothetical protein
MENAIRDDLCDWRDKELLEIFYPGISMISGATLLGDDIVQKLATCGERIESAEDLARHVRWPIGIDTETHVLTAYGIELLKKLDSIYSRIDDEAAAEEAYIQELRSRPNEIPTTRFYQGSSTQTLRQDNSMTTMAADDRQHARERRGTRGRVGGGARRVTTRGRGRARGHARVS